MSCDAIAGCDGFHGICRPALPDGLLTVAERAYPYAWLGILADVPPSTDELIYCRHSGGFALHSMRSPEVSRLYLQVAPDEDIAAWPDDRIWTELRRRFELPGWELKEGPILEKSVTPMRSFVAAPMRSGRLFLAGDAAHIVPPTGAKGLNLALADVAVLADALIALIRDGDEGPAGAYSATCLNRVWRATHFSWWMTSMLHVPPGRDEMEDSCSCPSCGTSPRPGPRPPHWPRTTAGTRRCLARGVRQAGRPRRGHGGHGQVRFLRRARAGAGAAAAARGQRPGRHHDSNSHRHADGEGAGGYDRSVRGCGRYPRHTGVTSPSWEGGGPDFTCRWAGPSRCQ